MAKFSISDLEEFFGSALNGQRVEAWITARGNVKDEVEKLKNQNFDSSLVDLFNTKGIHVSLYVENSDKESMENLMTKFLESKNVFVRKNTILEKSKCLDKKLIDKALGWNEHYPQNPKDEYGNLVDNGPYVPCECYEFINLSDKYVA